MNYFAHYFFDHEPGNHYYNAGLVLPDFARMAEGSKHVNTKHSYDPVSEQELYQLNRGSARHYQTDATFHNSAFFKRYTELFDSLFTKYNFPRENQRIWFISHIVFEVLIDRVLITLHPHKLDDFYTSLRGVELDRVVDFLGRSGKEGKGRFSNFWLGFLEAKYMQYYVQDVNFLYSVNRIITRARQPELTEVQANALLNIIHELEKDLGAAVPDLEKELIAGRNQ